MKRAWEFVAPFMRWVLLAIVVVLVLLALVRLLGIQPPDEYTIATGREGGAYYSFAEQYRERFAAEGVTLNIRETAGSLETIELLNAGEVDVGFVQNTVFSDQASPELHTLASVFYEPLWVFYTDELPILVRSIADLAGLRINVGEAGSATVASSMLILNTNNITAENSTLTTLPNAEAVEKLQAGEIDVMMYIAGTAAPLVAQLATTPGIKLLSFDNAEAYARLYKTVTHVTLPKGVFNVPENIPGQDIDLVAARATLVANDRLHPDLARLLLIIATEIHHEGGILEKAGEFPSADYVAIPMNADAVRYLENGPTGLERYLPLWLASRLERLFFLLLPVALIVYPVFRGAPSIVAYFNSYRIKRRYQRLREIEKQYRGYDLQEVQAAIAETEAFQEELNERVNVPTSMLDELYDLRMHTNLTLESLYGRQAMLQAQDAASQV